MTGFGSAEGRVGASRLSVELRTVNHRFFNSSIKLPGPFAKWEGDVRELLRKRISRGHVALTARIERDDLPAAGIDEERFARYVAIVRTLQERHGLSDNLDAATLLGLPGVLDGSRDAQTEGGVEELLAVVDQAASVLTGMRLEEGARLGASLAARMQLVSDALARIQERAPVRLAEQVERLAGSVRELAAGASVDPARLAQEVAIMADRLDVAEEIDRFNAHVDAFRQALRSSGEEPVGKRLGFLLQEMLREANTAGSKAADAAILRDVIGIKEELERIREQVENIE